MFNQRWGQTICVWWELGWVFGIQANSHQAPVFIDRATETGKTPHSLHVSSQMAPLPTLPTLYRPFTRPYLPAPWPRAATSTEVTPPASHLLCLTTSTLASNGILEGTSQDTNYGSSLPSW